MNCCVGTKRNNDNSATASVYGSSLLERCKEYEVCPESIQPFWISREPVMWPWCNLAASQRRPYCASVNSQSPAGLVSRQWDAVDWDCVLCDRRIHNDRANRSASLRQGACPLYSSRAGFFGKVSHHPGLSAPLQPRFGSLRILAFPKDKITVERVEICEGFFCQLKCILTLTWECVYRSFLINVVSNCIYNP